MLFKQGKINIDSLLSNIQRFSPGIQIAEISKNFLGIPYKKNSLIGNALEREKLVIDFEGVDCMTFLEYVEALRLSRDFHSFIENLKYVRYFDGIIDFKKRRHFFTDWNELKTVNDITVTFGDSFTKTVVKELNKNGQHFWIEGLQVKKRIIHYIPSDYIRKISSELKTGDYCGFYTSKEGLDVMHVGIIIIDKYDIKLRHASSIKGMVTDEDFFEYTKNKEGIMIFRA